MFRSFQTRNAMSSTVRCPFFQGSFHSLSSIFFGRRSDIWIIFRNFFLEVWYLIVHSPSSFHVWIQFKSRSGIWANQFRLTRESDLLRSLLLCYNGRVETKLTIFLISLYSSTCHMTTKTPLEFSHLIQMPMMVMLAWKDFTVIRESLNGLLFMDHFTFWT